jgi:iron-sulfur cluster repair protein YtfE (RIC family)
LKRHASLIPLTHDHHHALVQARRLRVAAEGSDRERLRQTQEFLHFFEADTVKHFRQEEELVFPLVVDLPGAEPILEHALMDHIRIHGLVRQLMLEHDQGDPQAATMTRAAAMLEAHIRLEEKTLFPLIERLAPKDLLVKLALER